MCVRTRASCVLAGLPGTLVSRGLLPVVRSARFCPGLPGISGIFRSALAARSAEALLGEDWRTGFAEFSRRAGDFALAMCAAFLRFEDERIVEARIGLGGATDRPSRIAAAEALLTGSEGAPDIFREAGNIAAETIDP